MHVFFDEYKAKQRDLHAIMDSNKEVIISQRYCRHSQTCVRERDEMRCGLEEGMVVVGGLPSLVRCRRKQEVREMERLDRRRK